MDAMDTDTASSHSRLPDYETVARQAAPRYSRRASPKSPVEPVRPRPPPKRLSNRPAILPAPSAQSPFEDAMRAAKARSNSDSSIGSAEDGFDPGYRISQPARRHHKGLRPGVHQFHGVHDARMHVPPELDEDGNPVRGLTRGQNAMAGGAAVAVVLTAAACTIM